IDIVRRDDASETQRQVLILILLILRKTWEFGGNIPELKWSCIDQVVINVATEERTPGGRGVVDSHNQLVLIGRLRWARGEVESPGKCRGVWHREKIQEALCGCT